MAWSVCAFSAKSENLLIRSSLFERQMQKRCNTEKKRKWSRNGWLYWPLDSQLWLTLFTSVLIIAQIFLGTVSIFSDNRSPIRPSIRHNWSGIMLKGNPLYFFQKVDFYTIFLKILPTRCFWFFFADPHLVQIRELQVCQVSAKLGSIITFTFTTRICLICQTFFFW